MKHFREVIRLTPAIGKPYNELGKASVIRQEKMDACDDHVFQCGPRLESPDLAQAHWNLGTARLLKGQVAQSLAEMKIGVQLSPDDIRSRHRIFADTLLKMGKAAEAIPYSEAVVKAEPQDAHARFVLGSACLAAKQPEQAVASFKEALHLAPNAAECLNALAWIYATSPQADLRNGAEAVRLAEQACQAQPTAEDGGAGHAGRRLRGSGPVR